MKKSNTLIEHYRAADKLMMFINWGLFVYALVLAAIYDTWLEAIIIGGATATVITVIYSISQGTPVCRIAAGASLMVMTALHIHQAKGMIEMHFGVFALLAMLLYYRDWLPIVTAAGVIAVHHVLFFAIQNSGGPVWILSSSDGNFWVIMLHAFYVVMESALLVWFATRLKSEAIQSIEIMRVTNDILANEHIDLTHRTDGSTQLLQRFDTYTSDIQNLATQVRVTANELDHSGDSLKVATKELKHAADVHHQETTMIASAIEQMSAAVKEVSNNASQAFDATNQVDKNASQASLVSESTMSSVEQLASQITEGSKTIEALNDQSNSIVSVLDVIRSIADQTNLLALNAAIEAARAGEQGRGFAVVADEVRTLAQRTQESTQEIDSMIEALQTGSKDAVDVMELSRNKAYNCVENTSKSLSLMKEVSAEIERINSLNSLIANSANEQTTVVDEISRNIANIQQAIEKSSDDASNVNKTADGIGSISMQLNALINKFKV